MQQANKYERRKIIKNNRREAKKHEDTSNNRRAIEKQEDASRTGGKPAERDGYASDSNRRETLVTRCVKQQPEGEKMGPRKIRGPEKGGLLTESLARPPPQREPSKGGRL